MNLRDALDVKVGSTPVNKIYKGTYKVWDRNKKALEGYCKQGELPSEYQQVEYIESNGTQFINTNYYAKSTTKYTIDFQATSNLSKGLFLFGSRISSTSENISLSLGTSYFVGRGNTYIQVYGTDYSRHLIEVNPDSVFLDGTNKSSVKTVLLGTATYPLYLMCMNQEGDLSRRFYGKVFNCKIYDNNILVRNFIPCYRKSDNEIGFYDTVNNVFYTNAGTGTFTKGADIPNPDYPQEIEVMQGKQVVPIRSENLFNYSDFSNYIQTLVATGTNRQFNISGYGTYQYLISLEGQHTISGSWNSDNFNGDVKVIYEDDTNENIFSSYTGASASDNINFHSNSSKNIKAIQFRMFTNCSVNINDFQIEQGSTATPWVPYKNEQYTVDLKSKNLFDVNDIYDKNSLYRKDEDDYITIEFDNSKGTTAKFFNYYTNKSSNLKLDTKYYIATEIKEVSGTGTINIVSTYQTQSQIKKSISYYLSDLKNNDIKVDETTTVSDFTERIVMIRTFIKAEAGQSGSITFRLSVLEEQPTVESFNYEPYYDYKLAGIGDYKDNFFTDKGKWYFKQNIKKHDLIGQMAGAGVNNVFFTTEINDYALADNIPYSNRFKGISNVNGAGALTNTDDNVISFINSTDYIRFYIKSTKFADYNAINEFLTNNKTYLYYLSRQPIITEVPSTYTTLINQLNALYQAM